MVGLSNKQNDAMIRIASNAMSLSWYEAAERGSVKGLAASLSVLEATCRMTRDPTPTAATKKGISPPPRRFLAVKNAFLRCDASCSGHSDSPSQLPTAGTNANHVKGNARRQGPRGPKYSKTHPMVPIAKASPTVCPPVMKAMRLGPFFGDFRIRSATAASRRRSQVQIWRPMQKKAVTVAIVKLPNTSKRW